MRISLRHLLISLRKRKKEEGHTRRNIGTSITQILEAAGKDLAVEEDEAEDSILQVIRSNDGIIKDDVHDFRLNKQIFIIFNISTLQTCLLGHPLAHS
jgi:hypothetical protein